MLVEAAPRAVGRSEILDRVWGLQEFPTQRTVDNAIVRLRQALGDEDGRIIRSVRGIGYQWVSQLAVRNRFQRTLDGDAVGVPPIWLMRQAGRYHRPYQALRLKHRFEDLCRVPELAADVAMGPIRDFDFDAAILFSDLLFPLEALGMALSYDDGPPRLDGPLTSERIAALPAVGRGVAAFAVSRRRGKSDARHVAGRQRTDRIHRRSVDAVRLCDGGVARGSDADREIIMGVVSPLRGPGGATAARGDRHADQRRRRRRDDSRHGSR